MPLKVIVDRDLCEANAVCQRYAPRAFRVTDDDRLEILVTEVTPELLDDVTDAVRSCPRGALTLTEE